MAPSMDVQLTVSFSHSPILCPCGLRSQMQHSAFQCRSEVCEAENPRYPYFDLTHPLRRLLDTIIASTLEHQDQISTITALIMEQLTIATGVVTILQAASSALSYL